ncbi:MAG: hypothetical protein JO170_07255 [Verrucomicrobia bacterium]|nr:hypothetical protein [Verrucomicrobiota bacterium]
MASEEEELMIALKLGPEQIQTIIAQTDALTREHGRLASILAAEQAEALANDAEAFPDPGMWKAFQKLGDQLEAQFAYQLRLAKALLALEESLREQRAGLKHSSGPAFPCPNYAEILARLLADPESFAGPDGRVAKELEETVAIDKAFTAEQWAAVSNSSRFYAAVCCLKLSLAQQAKVLGSN